MSTTQGAALGLELVLAAVPVVGLAAFLWERRRKTAPVFDPQSLGLELVWDGRLWRGRPGPITFTLEEQTRDRLRLSARHDTASEISAGRDGSLSRPLHGPEVKTRDEDFDRLVRLSGDEVAIVANLDATTRATIRKAVLAGWTAERGTWHLNFDATADPFAIQELARQLPLLTTQPLDLRERLLEMLRRPDELFWPRARALDLLAAQPDPARPLARLITSPIEPWLRARALTALAECLPHHGETLSAVNDFAATAETQPHEIAKALALVIPSVPCRDPEGVLLRLVLRDEREVAFAALDGLEKLGTIERTIPVLARLRDRPFATELGARAREVIEHLRRDVNAEAGRLSFPPGPGGNLALTGDPPEGEP